MYGEDCTVPTIFVDTTKVVASIDANYLWVGLVAGYFLTMITVAVIVLTLRYLRA